MLIPSDLDMILVGRAVVCRTAGGLTPLPVEVAARPDVAPLRDAAGHVVTAPDPHDPDAREPLCTVRAAQALTVVSAHDLPVRLAAGQMGRITESAARALVAVGAVDLLGEG